MPKIKTNSSCKKRFKRNGSGKLKRSRAFRRHHSWAKSHKKVRGLRACIFMEGTFASNIAKAMPN